MTEVQRSSPPTLLCFGLGYSAGTLARLLRQDGWRVLGTTRSKEACDRFAREGIEAYLFDRDRPLATIDVLLSAATHVLSSVPPDAAGDPVLDCHGRELAKARKLRWIGYLSTTGVYGDRAGGWVDESSALLPTGQRGCQRVAAETRWLDLHRRYQCPVQIFRLAGIYGPGRNALETVRSGRAQRIDKPGQVFSRIHVTDIAAVLQASMAKPNPGAVYNLCDDDPAPPAEVVAYACDLLGVPSPALIPFATAELSEMARSFYADSKRVSNRRIKTELGVTLRYPSYRDGLAALLKP